MSGITWWTDSHFAYDWNSDPFFWFILWKYGTNRYLGNSESIDYPRKTIQPVGGIFNKDSRITRTFERPFHAVLPSSNYSQVVWSSKDTLLEISTCNSYHAHKVERMCIIFLIFYVYSRVLFKLTKRILNSFSFNNIKGTLPSRGLKKSCFFSV